MIIFLFWACTQEISTKAINQIPEIDIQNPLSNTIITEGDTILMEGQITDSRTRSEEFYVRWFVEQEIVCDWNHPDDYLTSHCDWKVPMLTSPEKQLEIRAVVRDARQAGGSESLTVTVKASNAPQAQIVQPLPNSEFYMGESFGLEMNTLKGAWATNLKVRPEKDWEELKGRAVVEKENSKSK